MIIKTMNLKMNSSVSLPHGSAETVNNIKNDQSNMETPTSLQKRLNTADLLFGILPKKSSFDEVKEERLREL